MVPIADHLVVKYNSGMSRCSWPRWKHLLAPELCYNIIAVVVKYFILMFGSRLFYRHFVWSLLFKFLMFYEPCTGRFCCYWKCCQVSTPAEILEKPRSDLRRQFRCTRWGLWKSHLQRPHVWSARWYVRCFAAKILLSHQDMLCLCVWICLYVCVDYAMCMWWLQFAIQETNGLKAMSGISEEILRPSHQNRACVVILKL